MCFILAETRAFASKKSMRLRPVTAVCKTFGFTSNAQGHLRHVKFVSIRKDESAPMIRSDAAHAADARPSRRRMPHSGVSMILRRQAVTLGRELHRHGVQRGAPD